MTNLGNLGNLVVLGVYLVTSTFGLYMLKKSAQPLSLDFVIGFGAYAAGFAIWLYLLMRLPLSVVFPVAAGGLIVCTHLAGVLLLGEKTGVLQIAGVLFVLTGITLIYSKV